MDTHSHNQDDLSDVERRVAGWLPDAEGLSGDAVLFAAGVAAGRVGRSRLPWPALCALFAVLAAGLGAWGLHERTERQLLDNRLLERAPAPSVPPESTVASLPESSFTPAPDSYLNLRRRAEQDPGRWLASREPAGLPAPPPSPPAILRASEYEALVNQ
jgi:hypothetical protein